MRYLTIPDLLLGLRNLSTERKSDLHLSATGRVYAPKFARQLAQIEALPDASRGGRPLVQQLADKDEEHDGQGEAIYYFTEAVMRLPSAPEEMKEAAKRIREAFVPQLSTLRASYADEAAAATRKRQAIATLEEDLKSMAVPAPTGGTLYDWAVAFVDAGDALDKLLHSRSLVGNDGMSAPAIRVRSLTIGILSRFRASLVDEIEEDASLPRDLESRIFGYFDQLQSAREQASAGRK